MILVAKDTIGNPYGELWTGTRAMWLHVPRGGYGFVIHVPVWIREIREKHVIVEPWCKPGKMVRVKREYKAVPESSLRFPTGWREGSIETTVGHDGDGE